jgi:hypothetical protein
MESLREQQGIAARALEFTILTVRAQAKRRVRRETKLPTTFGRCPRGAYRRGDALEKRRKLMEAWSAYCGRADVPSNADGQAAQSEQTGADTTRRYAGTVDA